MDQASADLRGKDIDLIPPNYRGRESMTFICNAVLNQRAMNVQEAINLYEDQKYRNMMEEIERRKVQELQKLNSQVKPDANIR